MLSDKPNAFRATWQDAAVQRQSSFQRPEHSSKPMGSTELKPPIILIGNHRSGTTLTQELIGLHQDVATWYEPRTLWRYADPTRPHDESDENDATANVVQYIRRRFLKYQLQHGGRRIMEKTPSNVLRVRFVHKIFPEAIYLYITRNPFSCMSSNELKWHRTKTWAGLRRSLADVPLSQIHCYAGDFFQHMFIRKVSNGGRLSVWGPRYRGIDRDLEEHGVLRVIARQWARCNRKAREDLAEVGNGRVFSFRYEDLIQDPPSVLRRLYDHCGLRCYDGLLQKAQTMIDPGRQEKWLRLDPEALKAIMPEIQDEMAHYGYDIPTSLQ